MNTEQIRDELLAKARDAARKEGHDVEVTSVAFGMACARIAELEGALKDEEERHQGTLGLLEGADAQVLKQAAELEQLHIENKEISDQLITNGQRLGSVCDNWYNWAVEIVGKEAARKMSGQDMRDEILRRLADCAPAQAEPQAPLPNEKQRGIYRKFRVERADGSSGPGGKHEHCEYFVLDWLHDKFAVPAAMAYADACSREFPELARDLRATANEAAGFHAEPQPSGEWTGER